MNKIKMRFNDFVFETNPLYIEVIASRDVKVNSIYGKNSIANDICQEPIIVKGKGVLYGDDAQEKCNIMSKLLRQGLQGELHCPSLYPIKAIFTLFKYNANAQKGGIEYEFEFTQVCGEDLQNLSLDYTYAALGENAFDIAKRTNICIDDIMNLNGFESPFSIEENERVNLK